MELVVNGSQRSFESVSTLRDLLEHLEVPGDTRGVAVAVNDAVVPRVGWATTKLVDGDTIEVIHAVQGG